MDHGLIDELMVGSTAPNEDPDPLDRDNGMSHFTATPTAVINSWTLRKVQDFRSWPQLLRIGRDGRSCPWSLSLFQASLGASPRLFIPPRPSSALLCHFDGWTRAGMKDEGVTYFNNGIIPSLIEYRVETG